MGTSYTCDLGTTTDEKCVYPNEQRKLLIGVKLAIPVWMNGFECETHLGWQTEEDDDDYWVVQQELCTWIATAQEERSKFMSSDWYKTK